VTSESTERAEAYIAAVESFLRSQLTSDLPLLQTVCEYVFEAGGKRLRPGLAIVSGRLFGASDEELLPAAAAVEMIHTATLLHDDIMDASPMRRGRVTVSRRWNPVVAVYSGDFILSRAFTLLSGYGRIDVLEAFSEVTTRLCRGELLQARHRHDLDISVEDYLAIIDCKTAHFLSACCRVGGMLASAAPEALDALSRYGTQIGLAFQVTDDLLDYVGDVEETGKDVGADFREGKYTLPVIMALQAEGDAAGALRDLLASEDHSDETFRRVRALVIDSGAVEHARGFALSCTEGAISALEALPPGGERDMLKDLAIWIASRTT
jgi:geranylgeranyl pyrophosphate synthase